ncbi:putative glutathione S-transferase [Lophium mytilinum]|uniref:Putative glutathione S-transferase n=1 Tax=Lophium mytilinum TaxID=390894 RepID=A0A6A6QFH5_9PEZI|nr:putative glutathione S-transferase [Lophium mytilinum]
MVYRGWPTIGAHVWSPFIIKLEARLRFSSITYTTESGSPTKAPKGKIPYVKYRDQSNHTTTLGDSTLIINQLTHSGTLLDLNAPLSPEKKAVDLALRALLEDKLYFYHTWERWTKNYYVMRDHILSAIPYPIRILVGLLVYRKVVQTLYGQGTGRYSADEIRTFRLEIWENVNALLVCSKSASPEGSRAAFWIFGGAGPSEADAVVFGFVVSVLVCTASPESREVVRGFPVLVEYAERIHENFFPDYEKWEEI